MIKGNKTKCFLISVTIVDGDHEHTAHCLLRSKNEKNVLVWAEKQCSSDNGYFSYGDGLTRTKLNSVREITKEEAKMAESLGLVYFA